MARSCAEIKPTAIAECMTHIVVGVIVPHIPYVLFGYHVVRKGQNDHETRTNVRSIPDDPIRASIVYSYTLNAPDIQFMD